MESVIVQNCSDVTKGAAILKLRNMSKCKQAYVYHRYDHSTEGHWLIIGHLCAKFNKSRFSSFCVTEP